MTDPRLEKNAKIAVTSRETRSRHRAMSAVTKELKITESRLSKVQREALRLVFLQAKWLYNELVTMEDWNAWSPKSKTAKVRLPDGSFEERQLSLLGSQVKQSVQKQLNASVKTLATLKAQGKKVGALGPQREVNSISLIQPKVTFNLRAGRVKIQGLPGWLPLRGDSLKGLELANARLVKRASGYYLLVTGFCQPEQRETNGRQVGIDMGIKTHITTSDSVEYNVRFSETERLKRLQRKLQRQVKGSMNRMKTQTLINLEYEKLGRRKTDASNKIIHELLNYDKVFLQDENLTQWKRRYAKNMQHSCLGRVKAKLVAHPRAVVLDRWAPTTQSCPACKARNKLALSERQYSCVCDYTEQRDVHAARNMILMAEEWTKIKTPEGLGKAPVEERAAVKLTPMKQETNHQKMIAETALSSVAP